jgi:hypothetical protein
MQIVCQAPIVSHAQIPRPTETDTGCDTSVETLETVGLVDVVEGVEDSLFGRGVGVDRLDGGLHLSHQPCPMNVKKWTDLDSDNLNGLIPGSQSTTDGTGENLVESAKLFTFLDTPHVPQTGLGQTSESHSRSPVGSLTNSDGVDSLVDSGQTFSLVDILKDLEGGFDGSTDAGLLVSGNLDSLHARAET